MPTFYECQRCTACCQWPGEVKVTNEEITRMAAHLSLSEEEFIERYTRLRWFRIGLTLADKPTGECIFLDGADCRVHPVKPKQCRDFPNLWNFYGWQDICRALPREVTDEEYRQRLGIER